MASPLQVQLSAQQVGGFPPAPGALIKAKKARWREGQYDGGCTAELTAAARVGALSGLSLFPTPVDTMAPAPVPENVLKKRKRDEQWAEARAAAAAEVRMRCNWEPSIPFSPSLPGRPAGAAHDGSRPILHDMQAAKNAATTRKEIFKRAEKYVKEYRAQVDSRRAAGGAVMAQCGTAQGQHSRGGQPSASKAEKPDDQRSAWLQPDPSLRAWRAVACRQPSRPGAAARP